MDKWDSSRINEKKEILAFDLTKLIHGEAEVRRLIQQGGVSVSGVLADSPDRAVTKAELADGVKLKKGKKVFHKAILA